MPAKRSVNRRKFLKSGGRFFVLSSLIAAGFHISMRKNHTDRRQSCLLESPCRHCRVSNRCTDPSRREQEMKPAQEVKNGR